MVATGLLLDENIQQCNQVSCQAEARSQATMRCEEDGYGVELGHVDRGADR